MAAKVEEGRKARCRGGGEEISLDSRTARAIAAGTLEGVEGRVGEVTSLVGWRYIRLPTGSGRSEKRCPNGDQLESAFSSCNGA